MSHRHIRLATIPMAAHYSEPSQQVQRIHINMCVSACMVLQLSSPNLNPPKKASRKTYRCPVHPGPLFDQSFIVAIMRACGEGGGGFSEAEAAQGSHYMPKGLRLPCIHCTPEKGLRLLRDVTRKPEHVAPSTSHLRHSNKKVRCGMTEIVSAGRGSS